MREHDSWLAEVDRNDWPSLQNAIPRFYCAPMRFQQAWAQAFAEILRQLRVQDLIWMFSSVRINGYAIKLSDIEKFAAFQGDVAVEVLGGATFCSSGYVRQAAIRGLGQMQHQRAVPYLLIRFGDWVPQVRTAALQALQSLFEVDIAKELFEHRVLLERILRYSRDDFSEQYRAMVEHIRIYGKKDLFERGLVSNEMSTRMFCFRAMEDRLGEHPELIDLALRDRSSKVRAWLGRLVGRGFVKVSDDVFSALLRDKNAQASTSVIREMSLQRAEQFQEDLIACAMHRSANKRAAARFVLNKLGEFDLAAKCRECLEQCDRSNADPGWITCLGETGDKTDASRVRQYLNIQKSAIRAGAVTALRRIDAEKHAALVVEMLDDSNSSVRGAVIELLLAAPVESWKGRAWEICERGSAQGQLAAGRALADNDKWVAVSTFLCGLLSEHDEVRQISMRKLHHHYAALTHHGWIRPTKECVDRIAEYWPRARELQIDQHYKHMTWDDIRRWLDGIVASSTN